MKQAAHRTYSLQCFSEKDQRATGCSLPKISITDENDKTVTSEVESVHTQSPSKRSLKSRKHWYRRILLLKDDIETAYARLGSQIKSGFQNIKTHLVPSRHGRLDGTKAPRCLIVHYSCEDRKHRKGKVTSDDEDEDDDDGNIESTDKNYSPALVMHPLKEGKFSAHISLDSFPSDDNIVVKVRGYKLNIFQQRTNEEIKDCAKQRPKSMKCGEIDLPIYVDPNTLKFTVDSASDLYIQGRMKGSMGKRISLSADDLIINGIRPNIYNPLSQKKNKSIWYLRKSKEAEDKDSILYRERAYTSAF